jgi:hypothetical protein
MKAFTYLLKNKISGMWYYGVRYSKGCKTSDLFTTYFSSSVDIAADIMKYGIDAFNYEVRKVFSEVGDALSWEQRVLKRMKVRTNPMSYNKHYAKGFTTKFGANNVSNDPLVKAKRVRTLMITNICKGFKSPQLMIERRQLRKYNGWITFLKENKPNCVRMIALLEDAIYQISLIENKPYPLVRAKPAYKKSAGRSAARKGAMWFTSPDLKACKLVHDIADAPDRWLRGLKTEQKVAKNSASSTGRKHSMETRSKLKNSGKMYYTSPDFTQLIAVFDVKDVPNGWIKGNKLTFRNKKISNYLTNIRWKDK